MCCLVIGPASFSTITPFYFILENHGNQSCRGLATLSVRP
jgi:hypothetical protein